MHEKYLTHFAAMYIAGTDLNDMIIYNLKWTFGTLKYYSG